MRKPAEHLFPADPVFGEVDLRWPSAGLSRRELAEGAVWPGGVCNGAGCGVPEVCLACELQRCTGVIGGP
jgi:hypothetical protein